MCLIATAWRPGSAWPLVMAANRDEFFDRPSAPAQWWQTHPDVLAGQDLLAGGTWLGINRLGAFAALTNVRASNRAVAQRSRGHLPSSWLISQSKTARLDTKRQDEVLHAAQAAFRQGRDYGGFHLLLGRLRTTESTESELVWTCNYPGGEPRRIPVGIHAWSNGLPEHDWPKTRRLRAALANPEESDLLAVLADATPAADADLPDTGVGLEIERWLSAPFVAPRQRGLQIYGTRASTLLRVNAQGEAFWLERSFDATGQWIDRRESFQIVDR